MKKRKTAETTNGSSVYTGLYYRPAAAANLSDLDILSARDARASGDGPTCNVVQLQAMEWDLQCEGTLLVWIYDATVDFVVYEPGTR